MSSTATVALTLNTYRICLYEPNCDPGGYVFSTDVEAADEPDAVSIALGQAGCQYPDGNFDVCSIEIV